MIRNLFFLILLLVIFLINNGCNTKIIDFKKGFVITKDNSIHHGYVNIDECHDTFIQYKQTKKDTANIIPFSEMRTLKVAQDSFIVIKKGDVKDIIMRYYNYKNDIITKVEEYGAVLLLSHCVINYSSSMFTTEKFTTFSHILVTKGKSNYYRARYNPKEFFQIAEMFFNDNSELMDEITNTDYNTKIVNTEYGDTSNYETVTIKQIKDYVKKYNNWVKRSINITK